MADAPASTETLYRFGNCEYHSGLRRLRVGQRVTHLRPQAATLLELLLERTGEVVTREEIRTAIWGESAVVEYDLGISACIKQLRRELRDSASQPRFIRTIPRKGYCLVCEVSRQAVAPEVNAAASDRLGTATPVARSRTLGLGASWLAALFLTVVGASILAYWLTVGQDARVTLAVLPFDIYVDDVDHRRLQSALVDDLIGELGPAAPERLGVISRTSALGLADDPATVAELRERFGVDYVLDGSVRRVSQTWLVTVNLADARDQTYRWGAILELSGGSGNLSRQVARRVVESVIPIVLRQSGQFEPGLRVEGTGASAGAPAESGQ